MTEQAGVGIAVLGTIGIGATAETFEDARPMALTSGALLLLYGAGFAMLELAMRRVSALAAKSQPSQLQVSAQRRRSAAAFKNKRTHAAHKVVRGQYRNHYLQLIPPMPSWIISAAFPKSGTRPPERARRRCPHLFGLLPA
jgi:hypothetical protein